MSQSKFTRFELPGHLKPIPRGKFPYHIARAYFKPAIDRTAFKDQLQDIDIRTRSGITSTTAAGPQCAGSLGRPQAARQDNPWGPFLSHISEPKTNKPVDDLAKTLGGLNLDDEGMRLSMNYDSELSLRPEVEYRYNRAPVKRGYKVFAFSGCIGEHERRAVYFI